MNESEPNVEQDLQEDLLDFIAALNEAGACYLVIGGYAVGFHGHPRATKDLDIWIGTAPENRARVEAALRIFGAPASIVQALNTAAQDDFVMFGSPPIRIDLLQTIPGMDDFDVCWERGIEQMVRGIGVRVIGRNDLIHAKQVAGRPQDLADAHHLGRTPEK